MSAAPKYEPGDFCWMALATAEVERAQAFYSQLFGWRPKKLGPGAAGSVTVMACLEQDVAILYSQTSEARAAGVTPHWTPYILVEDVDATAARASGLGGADIVREPFEAAGQGRIAPIRDPTGAIVSLWRPRSRTGPAVLNEVGALGWIELATPDLDRAQRFYAKLFGWEYEGADDGYVTIVHGGRRNGGMHAAERPGGSHWLPYFRVENTVEAVREAYRLDGRRLIGRNGTRSGRSALLADPQDAAFAVIEEETGLREPVSSAAEAAMRKIHQR